MMSELGKLLRELRGKKSLRQASKETGLSHSYIADIEKGLRRDTKSPLNPSPDSLRMISKAYGYPYKTLLEKAGYIDLSDDQVSHNWREDPRFKDNPKAYEVAEKLDEIIRRGDDEIINEALNHLEYLSNKLTKQKNS